MRHLIAFLMCSLLLASCASKREAISDSEKALRQEKKALQARIDSARASKAMEALEQRDFLILVDRITLNHGSTYNVQSNINYMYVRGDNGSVQIASPVAAPGPNGIGGLTFTGSVRNFKFAKDKKGNATASYLLSGWGTTANLIIKLRKGHTDAHITLESGLGNMGMRADGTIMPFDPTQIVKGYPD